MNIALCDDNLDYMESFRHSLQNCCAKKDWICNISTFQYPETILNANLLGCHVLFLDIEMPKINGLDLAMTLHKRYPDFLIVYLTAYPQYAPEGYKTRAFRYLLKDQIQENDLLECLEAAWFEINSSQLSIEVQDIEKTSLRFRLRDILYISGTSQRHVVFHVITTEGMNCIECLGRIKDYEEQLKGHGFLRLQKSYLVNAIHINYISNYRAGISSGESISVSRSHYADICKEYLLWRRKAL